MAYDHQRVQHDAENARRYLEQAIPQLRDPLEVRNLSFAVEFFVEGNMPYLAMVLAETAKEELKRLRLYDRAIQVWGPYSQMDMAIEECAELIFSLMKYRREGYSDEIAPSVIEEIADVEIMCGQLRRLFDAHEIQVEHVKSEKLQNLERMMGEAEGKEKS
jgi:hypothetical protein